MPPAQTSRSDCAASAVSAASAAIAASATDDAPLQVMGANLSIAGVDCREALGCRGIAAIAVDAATARFLHESRDGQRSQHRLPSRHQCCDRV